MEIKARSRQCMPDLLDLTDRYRLSLSNDKDFPVENIMRRFPAGLDCFSSVAFDARGIVWPDDKPIVEFPDPVNLRNIHFLHAAIGNFPMGTEIGSYIITYANGQKRHVPLRNGENIGPYLTDHAPEIPLHATVAFHEESDSSVAHDTNQLLTIYRYSINNSLKEEPIVSIGFTAEPFKGTPFLLAITVEPVETIYLGFYKGFKPVNSIMPRNPWTSADLIDLSAKYTAALDDDFHFHEGHDLQHVPQGVQEFGGVLFDVRGLIQLAAGNISLRRTGAVYHEQVEGITVERAAHRLHFLHSCGWSCDEGKIVAHYVLHYADGQVESIPLVYGRDVVDWWEKPDTHLGSNTEVVWKGYNAFCRNLGVPVQLLKFSWENPRPSVVIDSIDMVSTLETAGLFLVAITLEPDITHVE